MCHWIALSKGKHSTANSESPGSSENPHNKTLQQTRKKVKRQVPLMPPSLPRYLGVTPGGRTHTGMPGTLAMQTPAVDSTGWLTLADNGHGLGLIPANHSFPLLNFSYTFTHQILSVPLEPMPFPTHSQVNYLCSRQGPYHTLLPSLSFPGNCSLPLSSITFQTYLPRKVGWCVFTRQNGPFLCWNSRDCRSFMLLITVCIKSKLSMITLFYLFL